MRAHGDSSASSVIDTFAEAPDDSQGNNNGDSSRRAALGQVNEILSGGPLSDTASHSKIFSRPAPLPRQSFPLALRFF
jgi:hypothetical protein